jgi:hypothetical protein
MEIYINPISPSLSQQFHQSLTKQVINPPKDKNKQTFISRVQRFDSRISSAITPGPGAYNPLIS